MSMDLTGIINCNEYYTNHYFASIFEENAEETISAWRNQAKESEEIRTPWSLLRENSRQYYSVHEKYLRSRGDNQVFPMIRDMADQYLEALGFPTAAPITVEVAEGIYAPVYREIKKPNGAPLLWVMLAHTSERDLNIMQGCCFHAEDLNDDNSGDVTITTLENEELATKILFAVAEPPRWIVFIGLNQIALIDRNKWNAKRYLQFDLEEIFSRREETTFQALAVLLHKESLCPNDGNSLLDKLEENSHRHSSGVSKDLKYALRESIELLGNEVLYDLAHRLGKDLDTEPVDASKLTIECLRYMYRMLFVLFIEARPELGYAPMKAQAYVQGYSFESLRDIADNIREETSEVGEGYYLHMTLTKLYELIYHGYPGDEATLKELAGRESLRDVFVIDPLKAHIFDPEYTPLITGAKLRNRVMLKIIDLMSITRPSGRRNDRRGRISYAALGINQMGSVYEALLSYRGFIAEETLFEVKRERDHFDELDVGYFVPERELDNYTEEERVRYESGENLDKLRKHETGAFIYRLAGREREKSASYYTPEVLTTCLVKYALKELLEEKTADEILQLTICEPAMGSAAFLNEAINQLAEAYLAKKQKELGETISSENRFEELQRIKMYIADRNVYGIDLNPIAVELAEVSLWLNTIYKGAYVPWFGTQLVNGNSLIGARKQCYRIEQLSATRAPGIWHSNAPERIMPGGKRMPRKQVYHFLMGDPGMSSYTDKVIKSLAPDKIREIKDWNRSFIGAYCDEDIQMLLRLSTVIDNLWAKQVELRKTVGEQTADALSVYGHDEEMNASHTTIREKDLIYKRLYKSEEMKNAGPYARLKFAMDYWCALWFWPIDMADLLPSRSEFFLDMSLILEGGIVSVTKNPSKQLNLFPSEMDEMANEVFDLYKDLAEVDLAALCERTPRLQLARGIAAKNKFMHWELEFADLFEERGGFDLIVGNPPWVKIWWNEQTIIADKFPLFAIRNETAFKATQIREHLFESPTVLLSYLNEYAETAGMQNYFGCTQNYEIIKGSESNLFKYFLPQAWTFATGNGIFAFIHPGSIFDEAKGGKLREAIYPKLCKCYKFENENKLFADVGNTVKFNLCIYNNKHTTSFDLIANLYDPVTIDQCYNNEYPVVNGIKDESGNWNTKGGKYRIIKVSTNELKTFAKIFDGSLIWKQARLPALQASSLIDILIHLSNYETTVEQFDDSIFGTTMWSETGAQVDKSIIRDVHFPESLFDSIISGPHIGVANPLYQTSQRDCSTHRAFDVVDLCTMNENYIQRCNYSPCFDKSKLKNLIPQTPWGTSYHDEYKILLRRRLGQNQERTLISALYPDKVTHINTVTGIAFRNKSLLVLLAGEMSSLLFDGYIKILNKDDLYFEGVKKFPLLIGNKRIASAIIVRTLLLNALTSNYRSLWAICWNDNFNDESWTKNDARLEINKYLNLLPNWEWETPCRNHFQRHQIMIEIDVLTAMALGMSLNELLNLYRIQFPLLQQNEHDTWYDQNGRVVFSSKSFGVSTFKRPEFERIKDAQSGTFSRTITDDTMPGGPIERTIEYVAPFDRCDREQDYQTAWAFFEERYKDK